jgi:hypothetical protein
MYLQKTPATTVVGTGCRYDIFIVFMDHVDVISENEMKINFIV